MRASQQRRVNTTLDNYKKQGGTGRITQTVVDQAMYQQQNINYQVQTLQHKGRAGSNIRNAQNHQTDGFQVKQQLTLTKDVSHE